MQTFTDLVLFRTMIAPVILQILFWAGIAGTSYGAFWLWSHDNWAWWLALLFGTLVTRVVMEFGILAFRIYDRLGEIATLHVPAKPGA